VFFFRLMTHNGHRPSFLLSRNSPRTPTLL
jgi:hypothetical protein